MDVKVKSCDLGLKHGWEFSSSEGSRSRSTTGMPLHQWKIMKTQWMKNACAAFLAASLFGGGGSSDAVLPLMTVDASGVSTLNVGQLKAVIGAYPSGV